MKKIILVIFSLMCVFVMSEPTEAAGNLSNQKQNRIDMDVDVDDTSDILNSVEDESSEEKNTSEEELTQEERIFGLIFMLVFAIGISGFFIYDKFFSYKKPLKKFEY